MTNSKTAILWDESFLWGLMAYKSFKTLGIPADIVTAEEVRAGALGGYGILFVPGGWSSDKTVALGEQGRGAIQAFVGDGGSYLGMCGGAGLALDVDGGLALAKVSRVPTRQRVPSFSGLIEVVAADRAHPIWKSVRRPYQVHAWWPGQFKIAEGEGVRVVATYGRPSEDFCLADLSEKDMEDYYPDWDKWEASYGINLNPSRLVGEPAIIEAKSGGGKVFLSYPHLETPGSRKGNRAFVNLIEYLRPEVQSRFVPMVKAQKLYAVSQDGMKAVSRMMTAAKRFIAFGERNFLWYWRNDWMLQWRRGVRGVEYSMFFGMIKEIYQSVKASGMLPGADGSRMLTELADRVDVFFEEAKVLLLHERLAMMSGGMSSIASHDADVVRLREKLFSNSKRFGGEFREILVGLDGVVVGILRN